MIENQRCPACGRRRKHSHEIRVGTENAHSPECKKYKLGEGKEYYQKRVMASKVIRRMFKIRKAKKVKKKRGLGIFGKK